MAAQVENNIISPRYTYISTNSVSLTIDERTGIATCTAYCDTHGEYTVEIECRLQRDAGTMWTTIQTWSVSGTEEASLDKRYAVFSGYTYSVYAVFSVRDSAGNLLERDISRVNYMFP
jgi:hypothetical protein